MKLVTRAQLGWPASAAPTQTSTKGVKVHYEGTAVSKKLLSDHDACIAQWKAIRKSHLANTKENYSDIAYNYGACPHGYLLEGRGLGKRTGANGNQPLNIAHYAIVGLVGSEGLTEPNDAMLGAIRDGIELLRKHGAGAEIKGHRDGYATTCPGAKLYAWVKKGAPRPHGTATEPGTSAPTKPKVSLAHIVYAAKHDPATAQGHTTYEAEVLLVEKALKAEGLLASQYVDGSFGIKTIDAYAHWQRSPAGGGHVGDAADGIPGAASLKRLAEQHGFEVED
ncbi:MULTISPECIES: peptidoglycan recognition family protein [unclassified Streptomyces]|uniref:peptidoglycan recognition protein family protein n=1 Tax=unclassified Streptomyces TaxID=2593676 RepID=UPI002E81E874|nr:peptidoglycan recognition family protein [Streptomyces sp. NBC_00589]WTI39411.1 peptidoglycan recognition protein family protein [Streptomyces sp. NBC_00775]WUB26910.1 peptidoglycan recognition protein family protein [Streptomyces sp. NBC_00589]